MDYHITYRLSDGNILDVGNRFPAGHEFPVSLRNRGQDVIWTTEEGVSGATHQVIGGVLTPKAVATPVVDKPTITADGVDEATITGIAPNTTALVTPTVGRATTVDVQDGELIITSDIATTFTIKLYALTAVASEVTINAV